MFSPPIKKMLEREGYPELEDSELEPFVRSHRDVVLVFAEGGKRIPEADDLAIILPEIARAFDNRFEVLAVPFSAHRELMLRYRFLKVPTLVFLRNGDYLGAITGLKDWADYLAEVESILASEPSEPPPLQLPGVAAGVEARP